MTTTNSTVTVALNNTIEAEAAREILGCSYPHIINLLHQKKLQGKKIGKKWFVDATDVQRLKSSGSVTPRPRKAKTNVLGSSASSTVEALNKDEIVIRITLSKLKYELLDLALRGKGKKNLKQHLEDTVDELHEKVRKHFENVVI